MVREPSATPVRIPFFTDQYFGSPAQPLRPLFASRLTKPSGPGFTVTAADASGCAGEDRVKVPWNGGNGPPSSSIR